MKEKFILQRILVMSFNWSMYFFVAVAIGKVCVYVLWILALPIIDEVIGNSTSSVHVHSPMKNDSSVIQSSRSPIFVLAQLFKEGKVLKKFTPAVPKKITVC